MCKKKLSHKKILLILAGSILLLYLFAAYPLYTRVEKQNMREAWQKIQELDLLALEEEEKEILQGFYGNKLEIIILDENLQVIYSSRELNEENQVVSNVVGHIDQYMENPSFSVRKYGHVASIRMRGVSTQKDTLFYVSIRKEIYGVAEMIQYSFVYFAAAFLIFAMLLALWEKKRQEEALFVEKEKEACENGKEQGQERLARAQKDFVANVTHELKTPLAVISGQVEMLQKMGDEIDREYYFESIREEIDKMSDLIGNILELTSMEHRIEKMELSEINLSDMMEYLVLKYDALFQKNRIKLHTEIEENCKVSGNSMYLEQAVNNYIMNAFQHTAQGKRMEITLKKQEDHVRIGVYNEGPCIQEKDMDKIWKSFYADPGKLLKKETKISNAGLGLYLVKKIVVQHGGVCGVENREDGVEFYITLPMVKG